MKKCFVSVIIMMSLLISMLSFTAYAEDKTYKLTDSLSVDYQSYQKSFENDMAWNIEFPVVNGFENKSLEKDINQKIRSFFMSGPRTKNKVLSLNGSANVSIAGSVGVFYADALYKSADDNVHFWCDSIAVDLLTGRVYTLEDLLKPGYQSALSDMLVSLDDSYEDYEYYRFTTDGVQFYTDSTKDGFLYLSFTRMGDIVDINSLCYRSLTDAKAETEIAAVLPFSDVPLSYWAYPYIYEVYQKGTMTGTQNGFLPDSSMSAAEFCVAVSRSLNLESDAKILYDAIPQSKWYSAYLNKAYETGLLKGLQNNFQYEKPITREDAMVILANALRLNSPDSYKEIDTKAVLAAFTDWNQIDKDKRLSAAICVRAELITGSNGKLMPKNQFTRAQVAKILCLLTK